MEIKLIKINQLKPDNTTFLIKNWKKGITLIIQHYQEIKNEITKSTNAKAHNCELHDTDVL